jgi:hypothetical protein
MLPFLLALGIWQVGYRSVSTHSYNYSTIIQKEGYTDMHITWGIFESKSYRWWHHQPSNNQQWQLTNVMNAEWTDWMASSITAAVRRRPAGDGGDEEDPLIVTTDTMSSSSSGSTAAGSSSSSVSSSSSQRLVSGQRTAPSWPARICTLRFVMSESSRCIHPSIIHTVHVGWRRMVVRGILTIITMLAIFGYAYFKAEKAGNPSSNITTHFCELL